MHTDRQTDKNTDRQRN